MAATKTPCEDVRGKLIKAGDLVVFTTASSRLHIGKVLAISSRPGKTEIRINRIRRNILGETVIKEVIVNDPLKIAVV